MEFLLEMQSETGITPDALKRRIALKQHERVYFTLFNDLHGSRQMGDSIGNIPFPAFAKWCEFWQVNSLPERERLWKYLKRMDDGYVAFVMERRRAEMEKMKKAK